jgi:hypothetical protein
LNKSQIEDVKAVLKKVISIRLLLVLRFLQRLNITLLSGNTLRLLPKYMAGMISQDYRLSCWEEYMSK